MARGEGFPLTGREVVLTPPLTEAQMRALKVGDVVLITGEMYTGRDNVHAYLMKNPPPVDLHGAVLYHCGPVMLKEGGEWKVKAAGPTTSIREEPYQADVIRRYGVRAVIGKGGMGRQNAGRAQGVRRGLSEWDRRRGAILRAHRGKGAGRVSDRVRHSGSHVASSGSQLRRHRDHGRARQQPACRRRSRHRRGTRRNAEGIACVGQDGILPLEFVHSCFPVVDAPIVGNSLAQAARFAGVNPLEIGLSIRNFPASGRRRELATRRAKNRKFAQKCKPPVPSPKSGRNRTCHLRQR